MFSSLFLIGTTLINANSTRAAKSLTKQAAALLLLLLLFTCPSNAQTINTLSPSSAIAGGAAFTLTLTGTNFDSSSIVQWNGADRPTNFGDATRLSASISAADIVFRGSVQVSVRNASGNSFNSQLFDVAAPPGVPQIRMIYLVPTDRPIQQAYTSGMRDAIESLQIFYRDQMGDGTGFSLHDPVVETYTLPHDSSWYSTGTWNKANSDGFALTGGGYNDPKNRWVFYLDADPACGEATGGVAGVALMPANDLRGLASQELKACGTGAPSGFVGYCRWIGGMGHELGHALGLPHPPGCDNPQPGVTCPGDALMWTGMYNYPDAVLLPADKSTLAAGGFFTPISAPAQVPDCTVFAPFGGPSLFVSATSLSFTYQKGSTPPAAQQVLASASGPSILVTAAASAPWLHVTPISTPHAGTLVGTPASFSVVADPTGLAAGAYAATLILASTGASNSPQTIPVSLNLLATPIITLVTPNTGRQGQTLTSVAIVGQHTTFVQGTTVASFGAGITVNSLMVNSATTATANFTVQNGATLGARTVTMTTGAEVASLVNGFTVTAGTPMQMLAQLMTLVEGLNTNQGIINSFQAKLRQVQKTLAAVQGGDRPTACNQMNAFINEVKAQSGKSLTTDQVTQLLGISTDLLVALGCIGL